MKKAILRQISGLLGCVCILIQLGSCTTMASTSSPIVSRTISIDKEFTGLISQTAIEIIYTQNNQPSKAVITGPEEIVEKMTYKISQGVLEFELPKKKRNIKGKITIELNGGIIKNYITSSSGIIKVKTPVDCPDAMVFSSSSSGSIEMLETVKCDGTSISIAASSSGDVFFQSILEGKNLIANASSSGSIKAPSIKVVNLNFDGSSSGELKAEQIKANNINIQVSSGADASVNTCEALNFVAVSSSAGDIVCKKAILNHITLSSSSGGDINLQGKADNASLSASSGGTVNVKGMVIGNIESINTSSGGNIKH